ncbi:MAG: bifunctional 2-methylcitrate dehydratase/aconitate hydratase [SAR86 cluster bacterium]|jgi:2-methylcitrate dehydratase|nr:bifunctional 2-methylcitrate dehydratase/aconitate hydratase [SAR86 cluster bacterium]
MTGNVDSNVRPDPDKVLVKIADYALNISIESKEALTTARYCLMDTLGCGLLALTFDDCKNLLGPYVENTQVPGGVRVPGTKHVLDPVKGAWDIGAMVRWLDFNDTWLAAEWGHPSDNLGGILAAADYISQKNVQLGKKGLTIYDVLVSMIKAHEIQGILALENSFNRVGLDHVVLVKIASTAVISSLFGLTKEQTINALSQAFVDGQSLRTYRHAPNVGPRKSWAAGDATSRALQLVLLTLKGQIGYPSAITAPIWGFQDVLFKGKELRLPQEFGSYVMENVLFKVSFPAEFHAQTAVEAAVILHSEVKDRVNDIQKIVISTQESAIRIISKEGQLNNPADRDHCIQYMTAVGLLKGNLVAEDYEDDVASDPRIDLLRSKMVIEEDKRYSREYLEADKRSVANAVQIFFEDGSSTEKIEVEYPIGHRRRREEGLPLLIEKFKNNLGTQFSESRSEVILNLCLDESKLESTAVSDFMELIVLE